MKTYLKVPKPIDNTLVVRWGRSPDDDSEDICYTWGNGTKKCDTALLHFMFSQGHYSPIKKTFGKNLFEELELRGYDLTTFKFTIKKKPDNSPCSNLK